MTHGYSCVRLTLTRGTAIAATIAATALAASGAGPARGASVLDRTAWTVTADSESARRDAFATHVLDGNPATVWRTDERGDAGAFPQRVTIDTHGAFEIRGLTYRPPTDGPNGAIGGYQIHVSTDGASWAAPVATGTWPDTGDEKAVRFAPVRARFVRLTALSEAGHHGGSAGASEIDLDAAPLPTIPRTTWTYTATCEETAAEPGQIANAFDGDPATIWHTRYSGGETCAFPHDVTIDLGETRPVAGLRYRPRQDGNGNGRIGNYRVDVSLDGSTWSTTAAGAFTDNATEKTILFTPRMARLVRLRSLSESRNRGPWTSAAEINLIEASGSEPDPSARATQGAWGPTIGFPLVPAAAALLPTNTVLTWSSYTTHAFGGSGKTVTATLDLATGLVSQRTVTETGHDMFCPGTSVLADGTVFVTGGDDSRKTSAYSPQSKTWSAKGEMLIGRGYQATTTLSNGGVFMIGGSWSGGRGGKDGERWTAATQWRPLPGVSVDAILTADPGGVYRADNHAWLFGLGKGLVFHAGPSARMNFFETAGDGHATFAGVRGEADAMNGNAVMYGVNRILAMGGAPAYEDSPATTQAHVIEIDPVDRTAAARPVAPMARPRAFHNSVVLPDGKVLVVGGQALPVPFSDAESAMEAELWDPATEAFTTLARMTIPRNYHSVALLLPDARVFAAGGGLCGSCDTNHADGEIFSPPYLFRPDGSPAPRPVIRQAPSTASHGQQIQVTTTTRVVRFSLVRLASATHSVNNDQRRIPLTPRGNDGLRYRLRIPSDAGVVLPGPYMLFALDAQGVPSVARIVTIGVP